MKSAGLGLGLAGEAEVMAPIYCTTHHLILKHRTPNKPYYLQALPKATLHF